MWAWVIAVFWGLLAAHVFRWFKSHLCQSVAMRHATACVLCALDSLLSLCVKLLSLYIMGSTRSTSSISASSTSVVQNVIPVCALSMSELSWTGSIQSLFTHRSFIWQNAPIKKGMNSPLWHIQIPAEAGSCVGVEISKGTPVSPTIQRYAAIRDTKLPVGVSHWCWDSLQHSCDLT